MLLPVKKFRSEILNAYDVNKVTLIIGETGSGKTTQIPRYICEHIGDVGAVVCTQPRRVAAISLAKRVSQEMGTKVGQQVGYSVRFDDCTSSNTRIKYVTDGMLLKELLADGSLSAYKCIVLDEVHERSVRTDILLGIVKGLLASRPDLKLVIMSATMDPASFLAFFSAEKIAVYRVPGRLFKVAMNYCVEPQQDYLDAALLTIFQVHREAGRRSGDILCFLTGQEEIDSVCRVCEEYGGGSGGADDSLKMLPLPLYAAVSPQQQLQIFKPTPPTHRKIVVATNIAETSITIPGIRWVIDCGMVKERRWVAGAGVDHLGVVPVSKANARQRSGRAGRMEDGHCYRLYTEAAFEALSPESTPEIMKTNLATVILQLKALGVEDVVGFAWLDAPETGLIRRALEDLLILGALDASGKITEDGRTMAKCPLTPQMSRTLMEAVRSGVHPLVIPILALLSADQMVMFEDCTQFRHPSGDHLMLLRVWRAFEASGGGERWCRENHLSWSTLKNARRIVKQLEQFAANMTKKTIDGTKRTTIAEDREEELVLRSFCAGYVRSIAEKCPPATSTTYKLVFGKTVAKLHPGSCLSASRNGGGEESILLFCDCIASSSKVYLRWVSRIKASWLLPSPPPPPPQQQSSK